MNKFTIALVMVATLVAVLMSASFVFAQGTVPTTPQAPGSALGYGATGNGGGMRGGRSGAMNNGGMGAGGFAAADDGILHDAMIAVYAEKLGISVDDLNARMEAGETMAQIAYAEGLTADEFTALMADTRSQALEQAVADGTLTQEQADWMQTRGNRSTGMNGAGRGMRGNTTDCPYYTQTTP
jgi:hypothetical protein